jgi:hypothetical protein
MSIKGFETDNPKTPLFLKNQRKRKYMSNGNLEMNSVPKSSRKVIGILGQRLLRRKKLLQWRRWIIDIQFALALLGILLMIVENELFIADHIQKGGMVSFYIKLVISISTFFLLTTIVIGYYISSQIKVVDTGVKNWLSVMTTNNCFTLALELFICGIHPFPGDIKSNYLSPSGENRMVSIDAVASILMPFKFVSVSTVLYPRWPPLLKIYISSNGQKRLYFKPESAKI